MKDSKRFFNKQKYDLEFEISRNFNKKVLFKMLKYINNNLKISNDCIRCNQRLFGSHEELHSDFVIYYSYYPHYQENILMPCLFVNEAKRNTSIIVKLATKYFKNLDNVYFILIFDVSLKPFLFYKKEEENGLVNVLMIEGNNIKPFK